MQNLIQLVLHNDKDRIHILIAKKGKGKLQTNLFRNKKRIANEHCKDRNLIAEAQM